MNAIINISSYRPNLNCSSFVVTVRITPISIHIVMLCFDFIIYWIKWLCNVTYLRIVRRILYLKNIAYYFLFMMHFFEDVNMYNYFFNDDFLMIFLKDIIMSVFGYIFTCQNNVSHWVVSKSVLVSKTVLL